MTSLEGILSARVVTTPLGEVSEIHVLAQSGLQPKQVVRNIESALLAQLGLKVDHRKISIAQTAEVQADRGARAGLGARADAAADGAVREPDGGAGAAAAPDRDLGDADAIAGRPRRRRRRRSDTPRSRVEGAAKAAVAVLDRLLADSSIALEGAKIVEGFDREFAFVAVQGLGGRETTLMTGTSEIKESAERAAVFAVLDATNRWTEARRTN